MRLPVYVLSRLGRAVGVIATVSALTFVGLHTLRPDAFPGSRGLGVELWTFLRRAFLELDLGRSTQPRNPEVTSLIAEGLPADVSLLAGALLVGVAAGTAAGAYCASRPRSVLARAIEVAAAFAIVAPVFAVATILVVLFAPGLGGPLEVGWFSEPGTYVSPFADPAGWLHSLVIPWLVLSLPTAGLCVRMMRLSMREVLGEDFLRTAVAKGLGSGAITRRHAVPAAASPVATVVGIYMTTVASNALLVEEVFGIPGALRLTLRATAIGDFPLLQGLVIVTSALVVLGSLAIDAVAAWLDPRVREDGRARGSLI